MDNNDMSEMIKKAQEMINNNQIPDDLKKMVANFQGANSGSPQNNNYKTNNNVENSQNSGKQADNNNMQRNNNARFKSDKPS